MLISVRVHPGAKKNEITGITDCIWQLKIAAPPVKGKANAELVSFLHDILGVPKGSISVVRGHTSRSKVVAVEGLGEEAVKKRLSAFVSSSK